MFFRGKVAVMILGGICLVAALCAPDPDAKPSSAAPTLDPTRLRKLAAAALRDVDLRRYPGSCTGPAHERQVPETFALSVLAAENYFRPLMRRQLELFYAHVHLALTNRLPEISLGVAQIKPASARAAILYKAGSATLEVGDSALLRDLSDPLSNYRILQAYLALLLEKRSPANFDVMVASEMLGEYNGQQRMNAFAVTYRHLVLEIFARIQSDCAGGRQPVHSPYSPLRHERRLRAVEYPTTAELLDAG